MARNTITPGLSSFQLARKPWESYGRRLFERSLFEYVNGAWPVIEPNTRFLDNWHIDLMIEYLEAVTAGQIKRLVINVPPRYTKSLCVSVLWPTWCWARRSNDKLGPDDILSGAQSRWIFASYADELSTKHSVDRRTVLESAWYKSRWGGRVAFTKDQNQKANYRNLARGAMFATSIAGAAGLGEGGDAIVIDDPHNTKEAESDVQRKSGIETFRSTLSTRHNDKKRGVIVVIMQRLNELDLSGYLLDLGGWEHLKIEGEFEERRIYTFPRTGQQIVREADHTIRHDSDGQTMIRLDDGGLLWPEREGPQEIAERKLNLGSIAFASQYQQRPSPLGGALFKSAWFRHWQTLPAMDRKIMVVDTAYSEAQQADFSNIDIWGQAEGGFFLIANAHKRCEFPELKRLSIRMAENHQPELVLIEPRASGLSLIQELKRSGPVATTEPGLHFSLPVVPLKVPAGQDKLARATAVTPVVEAGLVWLPDPSIASWVGDYEREVTTFPGAAHDDRVDCMVYALQYLRRTGSVLDFYRRSEAHQRAVEDARAQGKKPPPSMPNSATEAYDRSRAKWKKVFDPDN